MNHHSTIPGSHLLPTISMLLLLLFLFPSLLLVEGTSHPHSQQQQQHPQSTVPFLDPAEDGLNAGAGSNSNGGNSSCPVIVLSGAPSFTQSVFEALLLNAGSTFVDAGRADALDPCPGCQFRWEACQYVERRNECSQTDLPPPFAKIPEAHGRVLNLPLVVPNATCGNLTHFNASNTSCGANPFGDFDVMALSGETYRFQVTVMSEDGCSSHAFVDVYFDIVEIPQDSTSSSSTSTTSSTTSTWSSSESGCFPQVYAVLDGPFEVSIPADGSIFLNATASFVEDMDGQLVSCAESNCTFDWSVCIVHQGRRCSEEDLPPELYTRVQDLPNEPVTDFKAVLGSCQTNEQDDPLCWSVGGRTLRVTVEVNNGVCPMATASIVVHYGGWTPWFPPTPEPPCSLTATIVTVPSSGPFSPHNVLVIDGGESYYADHQQHDLCETCTYQWAACHYDPDGGCRSDSLPPPFLDLIASKNARLDLDFGEYAWVVANQKFAVDLTVNDDLGCNHTVSTLIEFGGAGCYVNAAIDGTPGFSHSIFDELTLDASQSIDNHMGNCVDCVYNWEVCHILHRTADCVKSDIPIPFVMLHEEHDAVIHLPLALLNVSCFNNSNITIGLNSSCAASPYGDFDMMALSGESFRFAVTVNRQGCVSRAFVDVYFDIVGIESSSIFTQYDICTVKAVLDGYPGFTQSIYDTLMLDASKSYIEQDHSSCKDCGFRWSVCHYSNRTARCFGTELPAPFTVLPHIENSSFYLPLVLANVSCNSNITMNEDGVCATSPYGDYDVMVLSDEMFHFTVTVTNGECQDSASVNVYFLPVKVPCTVHAVIARAPLFTQSVYSTMVLDATNSYRKHPEEPCEDCHYNWTSVCHVNSADECDETPIPLMLQQVVGETNGRLSVSLDASCDTLECIANAHLLAGQTYRFFVTVDRVECAEDAYVDVLFRLECTLSAVIDGAPWFSQSVFDELVINGSLSEDRITHKCVDCQYSWTVCHHSTQSGNCIDTDVPTPMENVSNSSLPVLRIPLMGYHNVSCVNSTDVIIRDNGTCLGPTGAFDALALTGETYQFILTVVQGDCASTAKLDVFFNVLEILSESIETKTPTPIPPTPTPTPPPITHTPTPNIQIHTRTPTPVTHTPTLTYQPTYGDLACEKCLTFFYVWQDYVDDYFYCELTLPWEDYMYMFPFNDDGSFSYIDAYPDDYPIAWEGHELIYDEEYSGVVLEEPYNAWDFAYLPNDDWEDPVHPGEKAGYGELFILSYRPPDPSKDEVGTWLPSPTHPYEVTLYPQCEGGTQNVPAQKSNICDGDEEYVCDIFTMEYKNKTGFCGCMQIDEDSPDKVNCTIDVESGWKVCETDIKDCKTSNPAKVSGRVRTKCGNVALRLGKGTTHYFKFGDADKMKKKSTKTNTLEEGSGPSRSLNITERDPQRLPQSLILRNTDGVETNVTSTADPKDQQIRMQGITKFLLTGVNCSNTNASGSNTQVEVVNVTMRPTFGANRFLGESVTLSDIRSEGNVSIAGLLSAILSNLEQLAPAANSTRLPNITVVSPTISLTGYFVGNSIVFISPTVAAYAYNPDSFPRDANITIQLSYEKRRRLKVLSSKWQVQEAVQPTLYTCGNTFTYITVDVGTSLGIGLGCSGGGGPMQMHNAAGTATLKMMPGSTLVVTDYLNPSVIVPTVDRCVWSGDPPFSVKVDPTVGSRRQMKVLRCVDRSQAQDVPKNVDGCASLCNCTVGFDNTNTLWVNASCPSIAEPSPSSGAIPGGAPGSRGAGITDNWALILGLCLGIILGCCLLLLLAYLYWRRKKQREEEERELREIELDKWAPEMGPEMYSDPITPLPTPAGSGYVTPYTGGGGATPNVSHTDSPAFYKDTSGGNTPYPHTPFTPDASGSPGIPAPEPIKWDVSPGASGSGSGAVTPFDAETPATTPQVWTA